MASARFASTLCRLLAFSCFMLFLYIAGPGCGSRAPATDPDAKVRINKLLRLYQVYMQKNNVGPPNEQALRDFGQKLSAKERDEYSIGEDLESIFTSPRDNQKYVIQYNLRDNPGGPVRAVAWEANGVAGRRFVALTMGYVEEYDEETFNQYKK